MSWESPQIRKLGPTPFLRITHVEIEPRVEDYDFFVRAQESVLNVFKDKDSARFAVYGYVNQFGRVHQMPALAEKVRQLLKFCDFYWHPCGNVILVNQFGAMQLDLKQCTTCHIPRQRIKDYTTKAIAQDIFCVLRKLRGRSESPGHSGVKYNAAEIYNRVLIYEYAYLLNCGHSVSSNEILTGLNFIGSKDGLSDSVNLTGKNKKIGCKLCDTFVTHAVPNATLRKLVAAFVNFMHAVRLRNPSHQSP